MSTLNTQITALHSIGADAMDNLYDIYLALPAPVRPQVNDDIVDQFRLRAEAFTPPAFKQEKYEVRYKSVGMNRPSSKITGDRSFSLTFRVDAYYRVYTALLKWRSLLFEPTSGYATPEFPSKPGEDREVLLLGGAQVVIMMGSPARGTSPADGGYEVKGVTKDGFEPRPYAEAERGDPERPTVTAWTFYQMWISDLTEPAFKNGAGDTQKVTATFEFGDYEAPSRHYVVND